MRRWPARLAEPGDRRQFLFQLPEHPPFPASCPVVRSHAPSVGGSAAIDKSATRRDLPCLATTPMRYLGRSAVGTASRSRSRSSLADSFRDRFWPTGRWWCSLDRRHGDGSADLPARLLGSGELAEHPAALDEGQGRGRGSLGRVLDGGVPAT